MTTAEVGVPVPLPSGVTPLITVSTFMKGIYPVLPWAMFGCSANILAVCPKAIPNLFVAQ